ncbi:MAG TPA: IPT/TIG domain-containing protein [Streptosporangiaceae bacterium]
MSLVLATGIASASGAGRVTTYPLPSSSYYFGFTATGMATADGTVWWSGYYYADGYEAYETGALGWITPTGVISFTSLGEGNDVTGMATGPDGNVWFTTSTGQIDHTNPGGGYTAITTVTAPGAITTGPDGNLWFTGGGGDGGYIGQVTPAGTVTTYANTGIYQPDGITAGADGDLWFTNAGNNSIGQITTTGTVTDLIRPGISTPATITTDGNHFWIVNRGNTTLTEMGLNGKILRTLSSGISNPQGFTIGPDHGLWFTNGSSLGRITAGGNVRYYDAPGIDASGGIAAGADGALWFANGASIGRITTSVTPQITALHPSLGPPGKTVTINGHNLTNTTSVSFNGTPASVITDTPDKIVTQVPAGATPGPVTVTTPYGTATSPQPFT